MEKLMNYESYRKFITVNNYVITNNKNLNTSRFDNEVKDDTF